MSGNDALDAYGGAAAQAFSNVHGIDAPDLSDPAVLEFAEQFALDVSSLDEAQRTAYFAATGDQAFAVVQQIYAADFAPRVTAVLDSVFGLSPDVEAVETPAADRDTWSLLEEFMVAVARLRSVDPVTTELVRLRGARLHDCAVCKSRRSQDAIGAGADDTTFDAVDNYWTSDLPAQSRAALTLTDALIQSPYDLDEEVVAAVRAHLSDEQIVEVVLDVMRNAANKIAVALGADAAAVAEGVELFTTDADGNLSVVPSLDLPVV